MENIRKLRATLKITHFCMSNQQEIALLTIPKSLNMVNVALKGNKIILIELKAYRVLCIKSKAFFFLNILYV